MIAFPGTASRTWVAVLFFIGFGSAGLVGCDRIVSPPSVSPEFVGPVPGRDELYVFGEGRLSLTAFETLREEYSDLSTTDVARVALIAQWLVSRLPEAARAERFGDATRCARAAILSSTRRGFREKMDPSLLLVFNLRSVAELLTAWNGVVVARVIEWNPALVREYGIAVSSIRANSG